MRENILKQYGIMAEEMDAIRSLRTSEPKYHLMADALYWEDEIPEQLDEFSGDCLRFVLRYRTSLIQNKEETQWRDYWREAKSRFPNWVGFSESRCRPDARLVAAYESMRDEAESDLP